MQLTKTEKALIVLGFIPIVSTVTGIIKAYGYHKKHKELKAEAELKRSELNKTAGSIDEKAKTLLNVRSIEYSDSRIKEIITCSVFEIIPGINIIAAATGLLPYYNLSKEPSIDEPIDNETFFTGLQSRYKVDDKGLDSRATQNLQESLEMIYCYLDDSRVWIPRSEFARADKSHLGNVIPDIAAKCKEKIIEDPTIGSAQIFHDVLKEFIADREKFWKAAMAERDKKATVSRIQEEELNLRQRKLNFDSVTEQLSNALNMASNAK